MLRAPMARSPLSDLVVLVLRFFESMTQTQIAERMGCEPDELTLKDGQAIALNRTRALADILAGDTLRAEGEIDPGATLLRVEPAA